MRVQKWLARHGLASRRRADQWIKEGRLKINGEVVTPGGHIVAPVLRVTLDDQDVLLPASMISSAPSSPPAHVYGVMYKPSEVLVSTVAQGRRRTIYDLPSVKNFGAGRTYPLIPAIGRLDYLSEGLLILTTDGAFIQRYAHPSFAVPKMYVVALNQALSPEHHRALQAGLILEDGPAGTQHLHRLRTPPLRWRGIGLDQRHQMQASAQLVWYQWKIRHGKNRFIRRVIAALGLEVKRLIRIQKGTITLPYDLKPGELRVLSEAAVRRASAAGHTGS